MISNSISKKVLLVGPHFLNHRGGIGSIINIQKEFYTPFNFIPTYRYDSTNLLKAIFFARQLLKIIFYLTIKREIRVLHIHSSVHGSLYRKLIVMVVAKVLFRKKVINHLHAGDYDSIYYSGNIFQKRLMRQYFRISDATITVSDYWKHYISTKFHIANVYFVNNVVPHPISAYKYERLKVIKFLFLGLIGENKGIFDLMHVLSINKNNLLGKMVLTVGGNGEVNKLKQIIALNQLEQIVEFKGWITGCEKYKIMMDSDVFILPSYSEGMPVSILEAMSYGMPIISTRVGGIPEIVKSGLNGQLVNPGDDRALLNALNYYLTCSSKIEEHGNESLKIIQEYFPENVIPKVEAIYKTLI